MKNAEKKRRKLMRKQKKCYYCQITLNKHNRTMDHVIPRSRGGTDRYENLVLACRDCNQKKGSQIWRTSATQRALHGLGIIAEHSLSIFASKSKQTTGMACPTLQTICAK